MKGKGGRILLVVLAAAALAVGLSQCVFLVRHPYFRKLAAQNGISLREARKVWGKPDKASEQIMGMAPKAFRLMATLAAPPSLLNCSRRSTMGTGASGDIRSTTPVE